MISRAEIFAIIFLIFAPCLYAQETPLIKNNSSVKIVVDFENDTGTSSGFLIQKEEKYFLIMTHHALHHGYQPEPEWFPRQIQIIIDNGPTIAILEDEYRIYSCHYGEKFHGTYGDYADMSVTDITNVKSFTRLKTGLEKYFLQYDQLAGEDEIKNVVNDRLYISSIYGLKAANMGKLQPDLPSANGSLPRKLLGFEINNCTPELNQNRGDSGGLVMFNKGNKELISGMVLRQIETDRTRGYAVDSIRIKETIDGGDKVSCNVGDSCSCKKPPIRTENKNEKN